MYNNQSGWICPYFLECDNNNIVINILSSWEVILLALPRNNIYCVFAVKNLTLTCKISTTRCVVLCFQFHHWDSREMCLETVQTSGALCLLWLYMQCWHCWDNLRLVNNFLVNIRELKQRKQLKSNGFRLAKQQLCTCMTRFCTFLSRRCTTMTWKCLHVI